MRLANPEVSLAFLAVQVFLLPKICQTFLNHANVSLFWGKNPSHQRGTDTVKFCAAEAM